MSSSSADSSTISDDGSSAMSSADAGAAWPLRWTQRRCSQRRRCRLGPPNFFLSRQALQVPQSGVRQRSQTLQLSSLPEGLMFGSVDDAAAAGDLTAVRLRTVFNRALCSGAAAAADSGFSWTSVSLGRRQGRAVHLGKIFSFQKLYLCMRAIFAWIFFHSSFFLLSFFH